MGVNGVNFNRTTVGLKRGLAGFLCMGQSTFNRTTVGLKPCPHPPGVAPGGPFNRTTVGLKPKRSGLCWRAQSILIAPQWD